MKKKQTTPKADKITNAITLPKSPDFIIERKVVLTTKLLSQLVAVERAEAVPIRCKG